MLNFDALNQLKQLKKDIQATKPIFDGTVKGTPSRFGFVVLDDGREAFLSPDEMQKVFPGDRVRVLLSKDEKDRDMAQIEKCLKSELKEFVGRYVEKGTAHFAEPDVPGLSRWLYIPPDKRNGAKAGDFIHCKVLQHPFRAGKPQVAVLKVLGNEADAGIESRYVAAKFGIRDAFPEAVLSAAQSLPGTLPEAVGARADLRDWPFVTIDSESTQDMDDALCAETLNNGWRLHVAIADPDAYIAPGSALDQEAAARASSFYFPDRVVPMLPPALANQVCSLVPGQDRLALVCSLEIAANGEIRSYEIREALIHSKAKLSYHEVAAFLADSGEHRKLQNASTDLHDLVDRLHALQNALRRHRLDNALLTEDRADYRIHLNETQKIDRIERSDTTPAHNLVEECMVATNRCAADFLAQRLPQALFVAHAGFRADKLEQVQQIAREQVADVDPASLSDWQGFRQFMQRLDGLDNERPLKAISTRLLSRSQLQAEAAPHFGMGLPRYTTFTSPIRKYNDLLVHRCIKALLRQGQADDLPAGLIDRLNDSLRQGRQAVNEMEQWLKCQYAHQFKGQRFGGRITHVNGAGFQVRLESLGLEGFVNLSERSDKLVYDPLYLEHRNDNQCFRIDQEVQVEVADVDMKRRQVQLKLAD